VLEAFEKMELKHSRRKPWMLIATQTVWHTRSKRLLVILLYTLLVFGAGYYVHRSGFSFGQTVRSFKADVERMPRRIQAMISKPETEHITIDIKHEDFMRLAYQREIALTRGILVSDEDDFVPATIRHNDESVEVRLRLKGDSTDHLKGDKWSFRIKVRGDNTLFGMKQFSIQHPKTRNYVYEWIFHQALEREGLVSLRYDFIEVTLNGKDLGVYALEEHFEKRLIENNQHREGPIVRFDEDLIWEELFEQGLSRDYHIVNSFLPVDIDTYQTNQMLAEPSSYAQHSRAIYLLESFRRGQLKTSDVFDVQKLARLFAIADLTGAQHSINWSNMRFYYNPITSRLEPIGFDGDSGKRIRALSVGLSPLVDPVFLDMIFNDLTFHEEYVKTLERISEPSYVDTLLAELDGELKQNLNVIHSEFPESSWPVTFYPEILYQNQQFIRARLNPTKGLNAYFHGASETYIELELGNIQTMPIEVLGVSYQDFPALKPVEKTILPERLVSMVEPLIDCKLPSREIVDYRVVRFKLPEDFVWSEAMAADLKINYRLLGTSRTREENVIPWSYLERDFVENDFFRQEPSLDTFDFLVVDESTQRILVTPGTWDLDRSLIIPEGYRVIARDGTQLNLSDSATILSYSPLEFIGSEDDPIIIQSTDSTGQGIVVMDADQISILKHVSFRNLSHPLQAGWELTGAVTFYESPVAISDSQFVGNRSEDALNIVRSEFSIDNTLFSETFSDAFDADFTKGKIADSYFLKAGNDAIDASGSIIEIQNISINGAGDKGLSVGERSQVSAAGIQIKNAQIAVASKDNSQITLQDITVSDSVTGLTAYRKKSEFGPASMEVHGLEMTAVTAPYLVEMHSRVVVDNQVVEASYENVYQMLYGEEE
jgi:hypothetical protein